MHATSRTSHIYLITLQFSSLKRFKATDRGMLSADDSLKRNGPYHLAAFPLKTRRYNVKPQSAHHVGYCSCVHHMRILGALLLLLLWLQNLVEDRMPGH